MNKLLLILSILITSNIAFACEFNCAKFEENEIEYVKGQLKFGNDYEQFNTLKTLVSTCELEDPVGFAKIRALLCANWNWLNRAQVFLTQPFSFNNWWQDLTLAQSFSILPNSTFNFKRIVSGRSYVIANTKEELRELMAIAITRSAKNIISLIYSQIYWITLFKITYQLHGLLGDAEHTARVTDDLDILTNNFSQIENPIDMAEFLLSFRSTVEDLFSENLKLICGHECRENLAFNQYCAYMREQMKRFGPQHDLEIFKKNLEKIGNSNKVG